MMRVRQFRSVFCARPRTLLGGRTRFLVSLTFLTATASCNGTTGYELVTFDAAARGAADAVKGQPYVFESGATTITLTEAVLHVGAIYLTQSVPTSGGGPAPCVLPGTYNGVFVGEVRGGAGQAVSGPGWDVDLLDPSLEQLSSAGNGSTIPAVTAQIWLMHGDVNAAADRCPPGVAECPILTLRGSAILGGAAKSFSAAITIDASRQVTPPPASLPGSDPICLSRIVQSVAAKLTLAQGGTLVLELDPKALFANADLSALPAPQGCPTDLCFTNDDTNQPSRNLFTNLKSAGALYRLVWVPPAP
jgi:hypothetical protein